MSKRKASEQRPESGKQTTTSLAREKAVLWTLPTLRLGEWTLVGESRAAARTSIAVPELGLCFDMGFVHPEAVCQAVVCVTHGHGDHIGALHQHAAERRGQNLARPLYVLPAECAPHFADAYEAFSRLNGRRAGVPPYFEQQCPHFEAGHVASEPIVLPKGGGQLCLRAYRTEHAVPSLAYCVWRQSRRLRPEYAERSGPELAELRRAGIEITQAHEVPLLAFSGDSSFAGVARHVDLFRARVLILECSFLAEGDESVAEARKRKHVHEHDLLEHADLFAPLETLVLCHFSRRYGFAEIQRAVQRLDAKLAPRVLALI